MLAILCDHLHAGYNITNQQLEGTLRDCLIILREYLSISVHVPSQMFTTRQYQLELCRCQRCASTLKILGSNLIGLPLFQRRGTSARVCPTARARALKHLLRLGTPFLGTPFRRLSRIRTRLLSVVVLTHSASGLVAVTSVCCVKD